MIIKLDEIPPEGLDVEVELDADSPEIRPFHVNSPIAGSFRIDRLGSQVMVQGEVCGSVLQDCSRCLKRYIHEVREKFSFDLRSLSLVPEGEEVELGSGDLEVEFFQGDSLDLDHLLAEQLSLVLPMKPLCSELCEGLCPHCGKDLAEGKCSCRDERVDPRWEALRVLKKNKQDY